MSTIVTRSGKGSPLSHVEVDANFTNLNTDKAEKANNLSDLANAEAAMANLMGFTSTATAAGTTTLTNTSSYYQLFTGSTTQTVVLPVTSTLQTGWTFHICNNSTGTLTVNSSGGNLVISVIAGTTVMCTCIGTTLTTAADWEAGYTDFSTLTGTGAVVLNTNSSLTTPSMSNPTASGTLSFNGSAASASNYHTTQTSGASTFGGTAGTGTITLGRSTVSQQTDIQAGATASGSTKTMNIGTGGLTGSTTTMAIGSTFGTSVTANGTWTYSGANAYGTPTSITLTNATGLPIGGISATGTPSSSTYLRGDGSWQTVSGSISVTGGDLTLSGNTGTAITNATLATVNSNTGAFGSSTSIPVVTVNAKGLVTAVSTATVAGGQYFGSAATKAIAYNSTSIAENITTTSGNNCLSVGPITIASGYSVTVASGQRWLVL